MSGFRRPSWWALLLIAMVALGIKMGWVHPHGVGQ